MEREVSQDLLEESHAQAITTMARYTTGVAVTFNKKVRARPLTPGDIVLKHLVSPQPQAS